VTESADAASHGGAPRPNIILILADDMGYSDIGCFGAEIATPNLDGMAKDGTRFSQFYNYARCCPTRASLLTGVHPHQAGMGHMTTHLGYDEYQGYLGRNCTTMAEVLKTAGYRTFMSGKWHIGGSHYLKDRADWDLGGETQPTPVTRGFDEHYGTLTGAGSYYDPVTLVHNDKLIEPEGDDFFYTDAIADNAVRMIDGHGSADDPFFLYLAFTAPHWPLHAHPEDIAKYEGKYSGGWDELRKNRHEELKGQRLLDSKWEISPRNEDSTDWREVKNKDWDGARMAVYAAMIDRMDQGVGRVLAKLDAMGVADNTLVIFHSDNGGCAEFLKEDGVIDIAPTETRAGKPVQMGNRPSVRPGAEDTYMSYDLPWANASNSPFRLFKHWVHEGGISTPFVARWPGKVNAGQIAHSPAHITDLMATFVEVSGAKYPTEVDGNAIPAMEGESLFAALQGKDWVRERPICIEHEGNCAVCDGQWKLVRKYPGDWELYDMEADRTELHDLSANNRERVDRMVRVYEEFRERAGVKPWDHMLERINASDWVKGDAAVGAVRPGGYA